MHSTIATELKLLFALGLGLAVLFGTWLYMGE